MKKADRERLRELLMPLKRYLPLKGDFTNTVIAVPMTIGELRDLLRIARLK